MNKSTKESFIFMNLVIWSIVLILFILIRGEHPYYIIILPIIIVILFNIRDYYKLRDIQTRII